MDLHCRLHIVGVNTASLCSGVLQDHNGTRSILSKLDHRPDLYSGGYRGVLLGHLDRGGEERYLAVRRALQAKVCHCMVRFESGNWPSPRLTQDRVDKQENHQPPVSIRVLHVRWNGPLEYMGRRDGMDFVPRGKPFRNAR